MVSRNILQVSWEHIVEITEIYSLSMYFGKNFVKPTYY